MRIARLAVVVAFLILPSLLAASDSTVTLPLTDFEKIREGEAAVSAVVIDTLELGGSFRDAKLSIAFTGRSIGTRAAVRVLDGAAALTISGCSGDALITRAAQGAFDLIPLASSFRARCDLCPPAPLIRRTRVQVHATTPGALARLSDPAPERNAAMSSRAPEGAPRSLAPSLAAS